MDKIALVFVHGILSSAKVWSAFGKLISADPDLAGFDVRPFEYASPITNWRFGQRIPDLKVIAGSLGTFLARDLAEYRRVVLVAHSQGGLVVQRYLHEVLADGQGHRLARVRLVVLFACPNDGSQFLAPLRWFTRWLLRNPQERDLLPLRDRITEARRTVLNKVVTASAVSTNSCPVPLFAYAGETDGIVSPQSARSVFPNFDVLPGDHSTIIQPTSTTHRAFVAIKYHLRHDLTERDDEQGSPSAEVDPRLRAYGQVNRTVHHIARPAQHERIRAALTGGWITVLHGLGGIGKSVLAFDACEDPAVGARFPDVLWATLGQDARVSTELARWLRLLGGGTDTMVPDLDYLKAEVAARLRNRHCLLVVDDAWHLSDVQAFNVGGEHCHLLVTTRDATIAHQLGVDPLTVPPLDTDDAVALLRRWARGRIDTAEAAELEPVVRRVELLPLAVKLAGAQLAATTVTDWLTQFNIRNLRAPRIEGVHDSLVATIDLSLDVLDAARTGCEALAVFPEDTPVTTAIVDQYWHHLGVAIPTEELLNDLHLRALTQQTRDGGDTRHALHDLVRDVLTHHLGADGMRAAHRALLDSYQEPDWPSVPDDGYLHDNLVHHLEAAGDHPAVAALFTDQRWMTARLDSNRHGYDGYLADLARAQEVAKARGAHGPDLAELNRYALIESSLVTLSSAYTPATVARAVELNLWTPEFAMSVARRACRARHPKPLLALLGTGLLSPILITEAETLLLRAADDWPNTQYAIEGILDDLLGVASPEVAGHLVDRLLRVATDASFDSDSRFNAIWALARHRSWHQIGPDLLATTRELPDSARRAAVINMLGRMPGAPADELSTVPERPTDAPVSVGELIASISADRPTGDDYVVYLQAVDNAVTALENVASRFTPAEVARIVDAVLGHPGVVKPARVILAVAPAIPAERRQAVTDWALALPDNDDRVLVVVALQGAAAARRMLDVHGHLANQLTTHSDFPTVTLDRLKALLDLVDDADERAATIAAAFDLLVRPDDDVKVDPYGSIFDDRIDVWVALFDESQLRRFLRRPRRVDDSFWPPTSMANLAQHATPAVQDGVVARLAPKIPGSLEFELARLLCHWMKPEMRTAVVEECLSQWRTLSTHDRNSSQQSRSDSLRSLAGLLDEHQVDRVIEAVLDIPDVVESLGGSPRSSAIASLGRHPLTSAQAGRLAKLAHELADPDERRSALTALAPMLPAGHVGRALALANDPGSARSAELLAALLTRIPEDERGVHDGAVHDHAAALTSRNDYSSGGALAALSGSCSTRALPDLLRLCRQLDPPEEAIRGLAVIAARSPEPERDALVRDAYALAVAAPQRWPIIDEFVAAMRILGPVLPNDLARAAWERLSVPEADHEADQYRLNQVVRLQRHHPELDPDLSAVRRMVGEHLTLLGAHRLSSLLYFLHVTDWLGPPLITAESADQMIHDIDAICTTWRWR